jgi:hypothetical protein
MLRQGNVSQYLIFLIRLSFKPTIMKEYLKNNSKQIDQIMEIKQDFI